MKSKSSEPKPMPGKAYAKSVARDNGFHAKQLAALRILASREHFIFSSSDNTTSRSPQIPTRFTDITYEHARDIIKPCVCLLSSIPSSQNTPPSSATKLTARAAPERLKLRLLRVAKLLPLGAQRGHHGRHLERIAHRRLELRGEARPPGRAKCIYAESFFARRSAPSLRASSSRVGVRGVGRERRVVALLVRRRTCANFACRRRRAFHSAPRDDMTSVFLKSAPIDALSSAVSDGRRSAQKCMYGDSAALIGLPAESVGFSAQTIGGWRGLVAAPAKLVRKAAWVTASRQQERRALKDPMGLEGEKGGAAWWRPRDNQSLIARSVRQKTMSTTTWPP